MITPHSCLRFQMSIYWVTRCQAIFASFSVSFVYVSIILNRWLNSNDLFWVGGLLTIFDFVWKKKQKDRRKNSHFLKKKFEWSFWMKIRLGTFSLSRVYSFVREMLCCTANIYFDNIDKADDWCGFEKRAVNW